MLTARQSASFASHPHQIQMPLMEISHRRDKGDPSSPAPFRLGDRLHLSGGLNDLHPFLLP